MRSSEPSLGRRTLQNESPHLGFVAMPLPIRLHNGVRVTKIYLFYDYVAIELFRALSSTVEPTLRKPILKVL